MKGSLGAMLIFTVIVFVVGLVWIVMSEVYINNIFPFGDTQLAGNENATNTLTAIKTVWNNWPLVAIFICIFGAFVMASKREPYDEM